MLIGIYLNKIKLIGLIKYYFARNGMISTKEFHDFLFPTKGARELGLLIAFCREVLTV